MVVEVWPDNAIALSVFSRLLTQWRVSYNGPTGLDYSVIPTVMEVLGIARSEWAEVFDDLRVMEDAALEKMREDRK